MVFPSPDYFYGFAPSPLPPNTYTIEHSSRAETTPVLALALPSAPNSKASLNHDTLID